MVVVSGATVVVVTSVVLLVVVLVVVDGPPRPQRDELPHDWSAVEMSPGKSSGGAVSGLIVAGAAPVMMSNWAA